ncbi:MAG: MMPL family transporter, partial [Actinomycetes bacterium]
MTRLAEFVLRHRRLVMVFWLAMLVVGGWAAGRTTDRLSVDFSLPGQPGYQTEKELLADYGNGGSNQPYLPVVTVPEGETVQEHQSEIDAVFDRIQAEVPGVRVVDYSRTQDDVFLTDDDRTTYALVYPPPFLAFDQEGIDVAMRPILEQAGEQTGLDWRISGYNLLAQGTDDPEAPSLLVETMLGALGALAVLAMVFASFLALVPMVVAAVSILTTFALVLLSTYVG